MRVPVRVKRQNFMPLSHSWKDLLAILEVIEREQSPALNQSSEEVLRRVVGRDARWQDGAEATSRGHGVGHQLQEDGVGVDISPSSKREALGVPKERACSLRLAQGALEGGTQTGVVGLQVFNEPLAGCRG